jgi:hypothetical protein
MSKEKWGNMCTSLFQETYLSSVTFEWLWQEARELVNYGQGAVQNPHLNSDL